MTGAGDHCMRGERTGDKLRHQAWAKGGECVRGSNENGHERAFSSRSGEDVRRMGRDA